ncbi:MAG: hypothetical protein CVV49_20815 [Spirochaetae bacterium HGW-Spirochaetae-5]|nr:MAG: hypothetical protein CVV49_20815 [Spirochaetae bacterium HGW-Spirochaetae-5]
MQSIINIEFFIIVIATLLGLIIYFIKKYIYKKNADWEKVDKLQNVFNSSSNKLVYFMFAILILIWITNKIGWNYEDILTTLILLTFIFNTFRIIIKILFIR